MQMFFYLGASGHARSPLNFLLLLGNNLTLPLAEVCILLLLYLRTVVLLRVLLPHR